MSSKKATKIDKISIVDLTLCSKCQIDGEDFGNFCGPLRKYELYINNVLVKKSQMFNQCWIRRKNVNLQNIPTLCGE